MSGSVSRNDFLRQAGAVISGKSTYGEKELASYVTELFYDQDLSINPRRGDLVSDLQPFFKQETGRVVDELVALGESDPIAAGSKRSLEVSGSCEAEEAPDLNPAKRRRAEFASAAAEMLDESGRSDGSSKPPELPTSQASVLRQQQQMMMAMMAKAAGVTPSSGTTKTPPSSEQRSLNPAGTEAASSQPPAPGASSQPAVNPRTDPLAGAADDDPTDDAGWGKPSSSSSSTDPESSGTAGNSGDHSGPLEGFVVRLSGLPPFIDSDARLAREMSSHGSVADARIAARVRGGGDVLFRSRGAALRASTTRQVIPGVQGVQAWLQQDGGAFGRERAIAQRDKASKDASSRGGGSAGAAGAAGTKPKAKTEGAERELSVQERSAQMRLDFIRGQQPLVEAFNRTREQLLECRRRLGAMTEEGKGASPAAAELLKEAKQLAAQAKTEGNRVLNAAKTAMTAAQADAERVRALQAKLDARSTGGSAAGRHPSSLVRASKSGYLTDPSGGRGGGGGTPVSGGAGAGESTVVVPQNGVEEEVEDAVDVDADAEPAAPGSNAPAATAAPSAADLFFATSPPPKTPATKGVGSSEAAGAGGGGGAVASSVPAAGASASSSSSSAPSASASSSGGAEPQRILAVQVSSIPGSGEAGGKWQEALRTHMGAFGDIEEVAVGSGGDEGVALVRFKDGAAASMAMQMGRAMGGKLLQVELRGGSG